MSYRESWSFLQAYRPWSIQLWPDGSGELADISCGDPWYNKPSGRNTGLSLVLARTKLGLAIVEGAMAAGYLDLAIAPAESWNLDEYQQSLLAKKGAVWGRLKVLHLLGLPVPTFSGIDLYECWRQLSLREKLRSTLGTFRRVFHRKLRQPLRLDHTRGMDVKAPIR
jgi:coenzyme F420 hydrogenase subunit beta